jgi:hypothetical protein
MRRYLKDQDDLGHFVRDTMTATECMYTRYSRPDPAQRDADLLETAYQAWMRATDLFVAQRDAAKN